MLAAACASALPALAAAAAAGDAGPAGEALQEVVVTARKYSEPLQDVPLSVTALDARAIEERRIGDARDLALFTPGFSYTNAVGRTSLERPVIRGQSNILGEPNASFFVDGIYLSGSVGQTEMANLERIEVIKGPQSALFGRATFAGAVNYVTRRPTDTFTGRLDASYGQHEQLELDASLSGPVVPERLRFLVAARRYDYGGEYTNSLDGQRYGEERSDSATLKLLWTPLEALEVDALFTWARDDDGHPVLAFQGYTFNDCRLRDPLTLPRSRGYYCGEAIDIDRLSFAAITDPFPRGVAGVDRERLRGALGARWHFAGGYELVSASAWSDEELRTGFDTSYAGYDPLRLGDPPGIVSGAVSLPNDATGDFLRQYLNGGSFLRIEGEARNDFSQELRLASPRDRPLRWLLGAYWFRGTDDDVRSDKIYPDGRIVPAGQAPLSIRRIRNRALFGSVELDLGERWTLALEARRAEDEIRQQTLSFPTLAEATGRTSIAPLLPDVNPGFVAPALGRDQVQSFRETFRSTTPRLSLRYEPRDDLTFYATYAEGNKPGGFNTGLVVPVLAAVGIPVAYDEEKVESYELGARFALADGRLRLSLAAFRNDVFNQQLTQNVVATFGSSVFTNSYVDNIGETLIRGFELGLEAALTPSLAVSLGYAYTDAEIESFVLQDQADLYSPRPASAFRQFDSRPAPLGNPLGCAPAAASSPLAAPAGRLDCAALRSLDNAEYGSVAGNRPPRAPVHQGFVSARYGYRFGGGLEAFLAGDVNYEGSKYAQVDNLIETGARTYLNLRAGIEARNWSVTLWGRNLNDDDTPQDILRFLDTRGQTSPTAVPGFPSVFDSPRGFALTPPRGRQVGVTAALKF